MLVVLTLVILVAIVLSYRLDNSRDQVAWGVTFSAPYARDELGLDWQAVYLALLDELHVSHLRLSAYWNEIEPEPGTYDFTDLDWQITQASERGVYVTLGIGRRLPRWPECHAPEWISRLTTTEAQERQLAFMETVVSRYRDNQTIIRWQVENEPFLGAFGICPPLDRDFLRQEIELVRSLSDKPVMVTDSGELSTWLPASRASGELLGVTMYRIVYNPYFGYFYWPLPPSWYSTRAWLIRHLTTIERVIQVELQAEPWHKAHETIPSMGREAIDQSLSIDRFHSNIAYARRAGFDEIYLWGVEWWYFMRAQRQDSRYWDAASQLWQK